MELGKTPQQYYRDMELRNAKDDRPLAKPSMEALKETLMKRNDHENMSVTEIQGEDYDQIKFNPQTEGVPDPRVGGASIIFDSRLNNNDSPSLFRAIAERP